MMDLDTLGLLNSLQRYIIKLEDENWALRQALGYPIPANKETINNPFKCGICDAREKSYAIPTRNNP